MKRKRKVLFAAVLLALAGALALIMLPVFASSGDYGVNSGSCPAGQVWQAHGGTSGGSCVWDGVSTLTPAPTNTPVPPTNTPWPTSTPYPTDPPPPTATPCPAGQVRAGGTSGGCVDA